MTIVEAVSEVGSGLNGRRAKLLKLLAEELARKEGFGSAVYDP